ncbi:hypothetical protein CDAR_551381 [Caerostris darwini]|uniref:Uncharacterized protein n=1 Tax=Caerostris darwini TaxID=1538125 RepID=A0AAV4V663_9ARAC|nr:hypothetical protein CDAR_551381 [Caerostris darwini]
MLMNKTIRVPLRTSPCPLITSTSLLMFLFFHSTPTLIFSLEKVGEKGWKGKQCDFQCEEIANDFSGTRIISLSGKREKRDSIQLLEEGGRHEEGSLDGI